MVNCPTPHFIKEKVQQVYVDGGLDHEQRAGQCKVWARGWSRAAERAGVRSGALGGPSLLPRSLWMCEDEDDRSTWSVMSGKGAAMSVGLRSRYFVQS